MEFKGNISTTTGLTEGASYLADTGSADNYAVALRPAITAYSTGLKITFQAANANTGSSTLAVNGLTAKTIKKSVSTNLSSGDILQNQIITVIYDGTNFQMASGAGGGAGTSGYSGYCGLSGYSGYSSTSGYSGFCGLSGYSGYSGSGISGYSGYSGSGLSGYSGFCGLSGYSGYSGSGISGYSGYSGSGLSGYSGFCGLSGYSGFCGLSGYSGFCGLSGYSGYSGPSGYSGYCGLSGYSGYSGSGISGYSGYCGLSGYSGYSGGSGYSGYSAPGVNRLLYLAGDPLDEVANIIVSKAGTITGTAGVGSSLFLQRVLIPAPMSVTEIDMALSIGFPATNQGAGTLSRSMVIYSLGNSTSLASVMSVSGTSAWQTGTSTTAGAASLTMFQGGWSTPLIQPMTFAASSLAAGEYVIGQLFDFAQGSSTWTLNLYGVQLLSLTSATLSAASTIQMAAGSGITGMSSYAGAFLALSTAGSGTAFILSQTASQASSSFSGAISSGVSVLALSQTNTAKSVSFQLKGESSNSNILSSIGTRAGSIITAATASIGAVTNVGLSANLPNFGFIGTGSTTSNFPTFFIEGIMSTGGIPTAITLTSTAVTYSGSIAFQQPWFALIGS